ncbi:TIR domain-containing protein [Hoeflea sp.]|uniref:TIR domain-containing protein n=1 Tax=Hoeflea sp. TaxID=1940281 RepID=UPI003B02228A
MHPYEELLAIADRLEHLPEFAVLTEYEEALAALDSSAAEAERAFSGSWQGYHAYVYYDDLKPPPPGAHFSQEWGMMPTIGSQGSTGKWCEYDADELTRKLRAKAGNPDLDEVNLAATAAAKKFEEASASIESIILTENSDGTDTFLNRLKDELDNLKPLSPVEVVSEWAPKGQIMTRDTVTIGQGTQVPPHKSIKAEVVSIQHSFDICRTASQIARKAGSHLERKAKRAASEDRIGTNVFIGHGQSAAWRELKDFIQDRLSLPWDEFNRVPVAGVTNQARLAEMLDAAAVALVVMTAEDETAEGTMQARMNVIHEVGLFQGRLGFTRAIVILEDGCEEFSNIQGLGQVRFPTGNIGACFEEVRRVLKREGLVES